MTNTEPTVTTETHPEEQPRTRTIDRSRCLFGHTDETTAYVVEDYPYGYTARTSKRYWIETNARHGDRLVTQTLNPKTGRWNKPKKSTYSAVLWLRLEAETEHVKTSGIGLHSTGDEARAWIETVRATLGDELNEHQHAKLAELLGWCDALAQVTWEIRPASTDPEVRAAERAEQDRINAQIAGYAHHRAASYLP